MEYSFEQFTWRSRLFLNSQVIIKLLSCLASYKENADALDKTFLYAHFLEKEYHAELYPEVRDQLQELFYLEEMIKNGTIQPEKHTDVVLYVMNGVVWHFTGEGL